MYDGGMTREEAEAALQAWATVQRSELVQAAHQAGVSKNRIHVLTGIARTTIDRILETPVGATQQALTEYLTRFTVSWSKPGPAWEWGYADQPVSSEHTAPEVAQWLLNDVEFRAMKLGTLLNTPDEQIVLAAVQAIAPAPYAEDIELIADAIQLAARQQKAEAWQKIAAAAALTGLAALALGSAGK